MTGATAVDAWTAAAVVVAFLLVTGVAFTFRPSPRAVSRFRRMAQAALLSDAGLILIGLLVIVAIGVFIAPYLRIMAAPPSPAGTIVRVATGRFLG